MAVEPLRCGSEILKLVIHVTLVSLTSFLYFSISTYQRMLAGITFCVIMGEEISKATDSRNCKVVRPEWKAKGDSRKEYGQLAKIQGRTRVERNLGMGMILWVQGRLRRLLTGTLVRSPFHLFLFHVQNQESRAFAVCQFLSFSLKL